MDLARPQLDTYAKLTDHFFFVISPTGLIEDWSHNAEAELGWPAETLQGHLCTEKILSEDIITWNRALHESRGLSAGQCTEILVRLQTSQNKTLPFTAKIQFRAQEQVYCVSFKKVLEKAVDSLRSMQSNLEHLSLSFKSAHMGTWKIVMQDNPYKALELIWDEEMRRMHGMPKDETMSCLMWLHQVLHPDDLVFIRKRTEAFAKSKDLQLLHYHYRVRWPNGEIHFIEVYASAEKTEPNEVVLKLHGVSKDITHEVVRQKTLDDQKNRMISTSRMAILGEISGGIAHEINNPLTVIQARAFQLQQMVEQNNFDPVKIKSAAESISKTGDKIAKIVKSLRAFSHNQEDQPFDSIPVLQLIQETLDFCKVRFYNHGIDVRLGEIPEDLEFECRLSQIEEVLLNVFNNAHDAILGLTDRWILIEAFDKDPCVEIHVTDSGPGIPENIADNIMLPFFTTKEIGKGTGLGLSIVTEILQKHHGQIYLDRASANTKFIVRLPKNQEPTPPSSADDVKV